MKLILTKKDREYFRECGKLSGRSMTPEQRKERSRKAANVRWGNQQAEPAKEKA
jgi:hypothetical protein